MGRGSIVALVAVTCVELGGCAGSPVEADSVGTGFDTGSSSMTGAGTSTEPSSTSGASTMSSTSTGEDTGGSTDSTGTTGSAAESDSTGTEDATTAGPGPCDPVLAAVQYDIQGADEQWEWVKLFNPCPQPINLGAYTLAWAGETYDYGVLELQGMIAPDACFLFGGPQSGLSNGDPLFDWAVEFVPALQNSGQTADAVALFDVPSDQVLDATPVDAVIYGTANNNALIDATGVAGLPHVTEFGGAQTLIRTSLGASRWTSTAVLDPNGCPALLP